MSGSLHFTDRSAFCTLTVWEDGYATLSELYSKERKQGHATGLLNHITWYADRHGLILVTVAETFDQNGMTTAQLIEFYKKFNFVTTGDDSNHMFMERKPL
jgi:GNAT superfamily N-acetyltransferase